VRIASKFGFDIEAGGVNSRPDHIKKVVEGSLRRLRTDRIDFYPPWDNADPQLLTSLEHSVPFWISFHERVFGLNGCHWLNRVRSADRFRTGLREAEVQDLSLRDEILDRTSHIFDRHRRIHEVLRFLVRSGLEGVASLRVLVTSRRRSSPVTSHVGGSRGLVTRRRAHRLPYDWCT
jgi:hypothetical protein